MWQRKVFVEWVISSPLGFDLISNAVLLDINLCSFYFLRVFLSMVCHNSLLCIAIDCITHLSKGTSGLKQKCTQTPTSFLGTVFHALSHDVIHFVLHVSSKNLEMEVSDWLLKNFNQWRKWFLDLTLQTKWITPCERAWKTVPQNDVASCMHFCLRSLVPFERCGLYCLSKGSRLLIPRLFLFCCSKVCFQPTLLQQ